MEEILDMYKYMPEGVPEVLGSYGMYVTGCEKSLGHVRFHLRGATDCGGDMRLDLIIEEELCDDICAWREGMEDIMRDFDPWDEAHKWLDESGQPIRGAEQFESGYDLFNDLALYKAETLTYICDALMELEVDDE